MTNQTTDNPINNRALPSTPPEIVAPAGGRPEFFAALNAGADLIYLGLKEFSARATADNFSLDDLAELTPLAHHHGAKIVVTLNTLIQESELSAVIENLAHLATIEIDALSIQDLGVVRLVRHHFPELAVHASTQMGLHHPAAVMLAAEEGISRIILARELPASEIAAIVDAGRRHNVDVEAFCHGSLCYSYSGMCLFGGLTSGRSGNRGRCPYPCRDHMRLDMDGKSATSGLPFNMRDLDTTAGSMEPLESLVRSGVRGLKIEGRKKDAQYVATVVRLMRRSLDTIYGRPTSRPEVPPLGRDLPTLASLRSDLVFSFQRQTTTLHLLGNNTSDSIDTDRPTHVGLRVGEIIEVHGRFIKVKTAIPLERFDGLRVACPHAASQQAGRGEASSDIALFSIRTMRIASRRDFIAPAGSLVEIEVPDDVEAMPHHGDTIFKVRSADLKRRVTPFESAPEGWRLRRAIPVQVTIDAVVSDNTLRLQVDVSKSGHRIAQASATFPAERPRGTSNLKPDLTAMFGVLGDIGVEASAIEIQGDLNWFVPKSQLKDLKRQIVTDLPIALGDLLVRRKDAAINTLAKFPGCLRPVESPRWTIRASDAGQLAAAAESLVAAGMQEQATLILYADQPDLKGMDLSVQALRETGCEIAIGLPSVMRPADQASLTGACVAAAEGGIQRWEIGNIAHLAWLRSLFGSSFADMAVGVDHMVFAMNTESVRFLECHAIDRIALPLECSDDNRKQLLTCWPAAQVQPELLVFGWPTLFISDNCPWRASFGGCGSCQGGRASGSATTSSGLHLRIQTKRCRTFVTADSPLSLLPAMKEAMTLGLSRFRIDFVNRPISPREIRQQMDSILNTSLGKTR